MLRDASIASEKYVTKDELNLLLTAAQTLQCKLPSALRNKTQLLTKMPQANRSQRWAASSVGPKV